jgi:hypothetical protein
MGMTTIKVVDAAQAIADLETDDRVGAGIVTAIPPFQIEMEPRSTVG